MMENQEKKPLYFYGEKIFTVNKNNKKVAIKRRFALAGIVGEDNVINIGRAVCSEKDRFVKVTARKIAMGRAGKKPINFVRVKGGETPATSFINFAKTHLKEEE